MPYKSLPVPKGLLPPTDAGLVGSSLLTLGLLMPILSRGACALVSLSILLGIAGPTQAVIIFGGTEGRNTTAPTGAFQDSGWQYEGAWQNGVGTAIAPDWFITARHLGGSVGQSFSLNGVNYTSIGLYDDPNGSDLRLVQIQQSFTQYAPLYTKTDELSDGGKVLAVFGRGTDRGDAVTGPNGSQGYNYGAADGRMSFGPSQASIITSFSGGPTGDFLGGTFSAAHSMLIPTSSTLSYGDSGGGVFIRDTDGAWKLAAVNYGVDGPYSLDSASANYFPAALYDLRGFSQGSSTNHYSYDANLPQPVGQNWYATRIGTKTGFISNQIGTVPEPGSLALFVCGIGVVAVRLGRRTWRHRAG